MVVYGSEPDLDPSLRRGGHLHRRKPDAAAQSADANRRVQGLEVGAATIDGRHGIGNPEPVYENPQWLDGILSAGPAGKGGSHSSLHFPADGQRASGLLAREDGKGGSASRHDPVEGFRRQGGGVPAFPPLPLLETRQV